MLRPGREDRFSLQLSLLTIKYILSPVLQEFTPRGVFPIQA